MEHTVRRKDRVISEEQACEILEQGTFGVLATVGSDGQPYGVPLSYVIMSGNIYFHCALEGQKVDNLAYEPRVTFTVCGTAKPVYDKNFSTLFSSAIIYGHAAPISNDDEKYQALWALCQKYLPDHMTKADHDIKASFQRTALYKIVIEDITGKAKT